MLGDMELMDDTMLIGLADEVHVAEKIFIQTLEDWGEKVNVGKTEKIRVSAQGRVMTDVRNLGELEVVRYIGSRLSEKADSRVDINKRDMKER